MLWGDLKFIDLLVCTRQLISRALADTKSLLIAFYSFFVWANASPSLNTSKFVSESALFKFGWLYMLKD